MRTVCREKLQGKAGKRDPELSDRHESRDRYNGSVLHWTKAFPSGMRAYAISIAFWMPLSQIVGCQTYLVDRKEHLPVVLSTILLVECCGSLSGRGDFDPSYIPVGSSLAH